VRPSPPFRLLGVVLLSAFTGCEPAPRQADAESPEVIGPETISLGNVYRGTFTPDGDTLYYFRKVTHGAEDYRIFRAHRAGGSWSEPERVDLGGDYSDLYPALTPDGHRMVFSSYRPVSGDTSAHPSAYLWYVQREGDSWGGPVFMADASAWGHYHCLRPDGGRPRPPDLHVSFRVDSGWTAPRPLRGGVNTPQTENFAFYSPGGRELYFVRDFAGLYHLPLGAALGSFPSSPPDAVQEPANRVLFVGNSFTLGHDLPRLVAERAAANDPPLRLEVHAVAEDGMTLEQHWRQGGAARRLNAERWDLVVLQEQSSRPLSEPVLMELYARRFTELARERGAKVILFETWARRDEPETSPPRAAAYRRVAEAVGAAVAPVGTAWSRARLRQPDVELHADDGIHANPAGARLAASVILETIRLLVHHRRPS
jgi:hypothetical protein